MRRSKEEIIIEYLELAFNGAKKTELVYKSMTNFTVAKVYIDLLLKNELLELSSETYKTTEKGKAYLKLAKSLILH